MIRSKVNKPDRVFANSNDDVTNGPTVGFYEFTARFQTPILGAKKIQLLRTTIPNAVVQIPDYSLVFWYYRVTSATSVPTSLQLFNVRLYPSYWQISSNGTKNRFITGGQDLVNLLNTAAAVGGDAAANNPYWNGAGGADVVFSWDAVRNQITFAGTGIGGGDQYYACCGYDDPRIKAVIDAGSILMANPVGGGTTVQPLVADCTLNLRIGYAMSGTSLASQGTQGVARLANLTNTAFNAATAVPVDSYPNLVYTGSVYLYADIILGSSLGSANQHNLLAVVPVSGPQLAVTNYVAATLTWLSKLNSDTLYDLRISMYDDNNQPYVLPDNAVVNVELGVSYKEDC
jgi:hypothetical protein